MLDFKLFQISSFGQFSAYGEIKETKVEMGKFGTFFEGKNLKYFEFLIRSKFELMSEICSKLRKMGSTVSIWIQKLLKLGLLPQNWFLILHRENGVNL